MLLCAAWPSLAQSPSEFYLGLLRRGVAFVEAGQYDAATTPLRIAAFGLVESVEKYELALVYLAVAQERTGNLDGARDSVNRILAAERVERKFTSLSLPSAIRTAFDGVAKKVLSAAEANALASGGAVAPPQRSQPVITTRPVTPPGAASSSPAPAPAGPEASEVKPEMSAAKPETSTAKPEATAAKPEATAAKPEAAPTKPRATEVKPEAAQAKPGTSETKPRTAETKPAPPRKPETKPLPPPQTAAAAPPVKQPAAPAPKPGLAAEEIANRLAAAERALNAAQLPEARRTFRELLEAPGLDRESLLRVSEGLYRARDFAGALAAFKALGPLRRGEEPYGYYQAVSYYETGAYEAAKKELAAALPFIEMTPDVFRYRAKIEGSR